MSTKPSCVEFRVPLLSVLATLSGGVAGVPVEMTRTYFPVCQLLQIGEDEFGSSTHGTLWAHRQVGLAMRALRKGGYTDQKKKAQWEITELGLRFLKEGTGTLSDLPEEDEEVETMASVIHLPTIKSPYDEDAYLRSVAMEHTACFGSFSPRSDVCTGCLLASSCVHALDAQLAELAAELEIEEARMAASARAQRKAKENQNASIEELLKLDEIEAPAPTAAARASAIDAKVSREVVCGSCSKPIPKGEQGTWYPKPGVVCHKTCPPPPEAMS